MQTQQFAGANKTNTSFLSPLERRFSPLVLPRIPKWLQTYHLTMLTLAWSVLIVAFSYLAANNIRWLWGVSVMIFFQYLTDHFDGKLGKHRNTGLVRWGYYMDHFLDYVFLCSVIIGYAFILPEKSRYQVLFLLAVFGAFAVSAFLAYSATDRLTISHLKLGPTEFRLALIIINTLLIFFGTKYMISGLKYVNAGALLGLFFVVYKTQQNIWSRDMQRNPRQTTHEPAVAKSYAGSPELYVFTSISSKITPLKPTKGAEFSRKFLRRRFLSSIETAAARSLQDKPTTAFYNCNSNGNTELQKTKSVLKETETKVNRQCQVRKQFES